MPCGVSRFEYSPTPSGMQDQRARDAIGPKAYFRLERTFLRRKRANGPVRGEKSRNDRAHHGAGLGEYREKEYAQDESAQCPQRQSSLHHAGQPAVCLEKGNVHGLRRFLCGFEGRDGLAPRPRSSRSCRVFSGRRSMSRIFCIFPTRPFARNSFTLS